MSEDDRYAGFLRALGEPPPVPAAEGAGVLTPEFIGRALDEMWREGARMQLPCDSGCRCCEPGAEPS